MNKRGVMPLPQWLASGCMGLSLLLLAGCASNRTGSSESVQAQGSPAMPVHSAGMPMQPAGGAVHLVRPGDTLYSIATRNGLPWQEVARLNGITPPYTIRVGQTLSLGGGGMAVAPAPVVSVPQPAVMPAVVPPAGQPVQSQPVMVAPPVVSQPVVAPVVAPAVTAPPVGASVQPPKPAPAAVVASAPVAAPSAPVPARPQAPVTLGPVKSWQWPARGQVIRTFAPGNATNPSKGIDIAGQVGQPVVAAAAGEVVYAGSGLQGYGQLLLIRHNSTYVTAYGHNQRLLVQEGQMVRAGEKIAEMGSSGTDRVKLHFEIRKDGKPVDPQQLLPRS